MTMHMSVAEFERVTGRKPLMSGTHDCRQVAALESFGWTFVEVTRVSDEIKSWVVGQRGSDPARAR